MTYARATEGLRAGEPPKSRIVLSVFENIDKAKAAYTSPAYLEARKIGDKYAILRIFFASGTFGVRYHETLDFFRITGALRCKANNFFGHDCN